MNNKNKKNRSIFEKRGFYVALYSCIGVVLVLAIGITYNSMNGGGADMLGITGRQATPPGAATPTPAPTQPRTSTNNDHLLEEVRVEEGSIRDILPILPRQNEEPIEEVPPQEPAQPSEPVAPPAEARAPQPEPQPEPEPVQPPATQERTDAESGLTYVPETVPVMQPIVSYTISASEDNNQVAPQEEQPGTEEVRVIEWDDDPIAYEGIIADPVFNVFTGNNDMGWPVRGDVVMDFSMDSLIHDITLNQFRTNDKISIGANVGTQVRAASDGVVRNITNDRRLGNTVVIEHGNGWFTTYSQLQDHILVEVGDVVIKDQVIGGVGQPSIFYTLLGSHLSFRVTRDDVPVNPLLVLGH